MKNLEDMTLEELWQLFPIILKEHDSKYALWYQEQKDSLSRILKDFNIRRISHIGSTAVKGLFAKPIVDILLELSDDYNTNDVCDLLYKYGWIIMARDNTHKTIDLNKGYTPSGFADKVFHLHIKPQGDWDELYFRDYLIAHPDIARQYETLKLSLLKRFEHNRDAYTDAKSEFVLSNTRRARSEFANRYASFTNRAADNK